MKKRLFALSLALALALALTGTQGFAMDSLSDLHWKKRVLLVFGEARDRDAERQVERLAGKAAELDDRDMVVIRISGDEAEVVHGHAPKPNGRALREEADVHDGFRVVLIGKDGGVKLKSPTVVNDLELFGLIDRMPMRRAEKSERP